MQDVHFLMKKKRKKRREPDRETEMCAGLAAAKAHKSPASAKALSPMCRN